MDSVNEILDRKRFVEPPESIAIKDYVKTKYNAVIGVNCNHNTIVIISGSAALATTLRLEITELKKVAQTNKKLIFRISDS
ncbi:MAG TPA: hypothetical protein VMR08_02015 [Patescibacteria group bacterium]|jgi:hypothetical protein|nr:hypothetical protein [Patescibacteria group bacterium]